MDITTILVEMLQQSCVSRETCHNYELIRGSDVYEIVGECPHKKICDEIGDAISHASVEQILNAIQNEN
ncbi:MAG: hypothetical protein Q4B85_05570 [Lachnospiraceae bacterium]|nr:hypothetical protein [Lachnospiraceae bacterium]